MSVIVGSTNNLTSSVFVVSEGTSADYLNALDRRTDIGAEFTMSDVGGGAGRLKLTFTFNSDVTVNSFAMHHLHGFPADATWQVARYSSTVFLPGFLIDSSPVKPVAQTYTAESKIGNPDVKGHALHTFTTAQPDGKLTTVDASNVRGLLVTIESPSSIATVGIGMLAAFETYALSDSDYNDGSGSSPGLSSTTKKPRQAFNGGVPTAASRQTENPAFVMTLSAEDKNTLEGAYLAAGLDQPVYLEFLPDRTEWRDREAQGGVVRFVNPPPFSPLGGFSGTETDRYSLKSTSWTIWR